jgi:hypothetical protein
MSFDLEKRKFFEIALKLGLDPWAYFAMTLLTMERRWGIRLFL